MKNLSVISVLFTLVFSLFSVACREPDKNKSPDSNLWLMRLKNQIQMAEQPFFSSNYMQDDEDPFYLNGVAEMINNAKGPLSSHQKQDLAYLRKDLPQTLSLLSSRLEDLEKLYTITASMAAYDLDDLMGKMFTLPDLQTKGLFLRFQRLLQDESIYDKETLRFNEAALNKAYELSTEVQTRVLARASTALPTQLNEAEKEEFALLQLKIKALNPQLVELFALEPTQSPNSTWLSLMNHYSGVLGVFEMANKALDSGVPSFAIDWGTLKKEELRLLAQLKKQTTNQHDLTQALIKENL